MTYLRIIITIYILSHVSAHVFAQLPFASSYQEGFALSKVSNSPMMLFFTTRFCEPCKQMNDLLSKDTLIVDFLNQNFICIRIEESSKTIEYLDKYGIESFPSIHFVRPDETSLVSIRGAATASEVVQTAERAILYYRGFQDFMMDLDTVTTYSSLNQLMADYIRFNPSDDIFNVLNQAARSIPRIRRMMFESIPEQMDYRNLYSVYIEDPAVFINSNKLRDALVYSFFKQNRSLLTKKDVKKLNEYFSLLGFGDLSETVAYIKVLELFKDQITAQKLNQEYFIPLTPIREFIITYPHAHDKKIVSEAIKLLASNNKSKSYYKKLYKVVKSKLQDTSDDFMLYDIMSVCQYVYGNRDEAVKLIIKANELAYQANQNYEPTLRLIIQK